MRREGYEFAVSKAEVLYKYNDRNQKLEPMELAYIDVPEEFTGAVIQKLTSSLFWHPEKYTTSVGNAESLDELYQRTGAFLHEVIEPQLRQGKDILIMGHGAMNSSIVCQVRKLPREEFWSAGIENCKLMRLVGSHVG